jgi:hypothetical protein
MLLPRNCPSVRLQKGIQPGEIAENPQPRDSLVRELEERRSQPRNVLVRRCEAAKRRHVSTGESHLCKGALSLCDAIEEAS